MSVQQQDRINVEDFKEFVFSQKEFKCEKDEFENLREAMDMYFNREEITKERYFDLLPKSIREDVRFNIADDIKKNEVFEDLLEDILSEIEEAYGNYNISQLDEILQEIDNNNKDFELNMSNIGAEHSITTVSDIIMSLKKKLESSEDDNDKAKYTAAIESLNRVIDPTHIKELAANMKFKNFDLSEPKRKYDLVLSKYRNSGMNIYKITDLEKILLSIYHKDNINITSIRKLLITFCEYSADMDNKNPNDHLYMYYFCKDIVNMHMINKKKLQKKSFDANLIYQKSYNKYKDLLLLF